MKKSFFGKKILVFIVKPGFPGLSGGHGLTVSQLPAGRWPEAP